MDRHAIGHCSRVNRRSTIIVILFCAFLAIFLQFSLFGQPAYASAQSSYCVIETSSMRVIDGNNIDARLPMASTTKAMTALIATESGKLDDVVEIPQEAVGVEGSSIYLKAGERLTLRDLTYGLMLRSGNDAATAIALYLGGSIENFANMMNDRAQALKLKNTHFTNPHGLHDDNHYTSAYDLAVIAATALKNQECARIVGTKTYRAGSGDNVRVFNNKNKILYNYDGATGFKTGYTKRAGRCLISSSKRNGLEVVAVVLNVPSMYEKCAELMNYAHNNYSATTLFSCKDIITEVPIKCGTSSAVGIRAIEDVSVAVRTGDRVSYNCVLPDYIDNSLLQGSLVGKIQVFINEQLQFSRDLVTMDEVTILEKSNEN